MIAASHPNPFMATSTVDTATLAVNDLLGQHPDNPVHETRFHTGSSKKWAESYAPITKVNVHTRVVGRSQGAWEAVPIVVADFDQAFLPEYADDAKRLGLPVHPVNYRTWRFQAERDGLLWFHSEISNIVLAAWAKHPNMLQVAEEKSLTGEPHKEIIDVGYSTRRDRKRVHMAIGEFKRGLLNFDAWQNNRIKGKASQAAFSKELRGYVHIYICICHAASPALSSLFVLFLLCWC